MHMKRHKDSFKLLYMKKNPNVNATGFDWNGAYAIIISPEFTRIQLDSAQTTPALKLYTVSVYEDGIISLTRMGGEKRAEPTGGDPNPVPIPAPKPAAEIDQLYSTARAKLPLIFSGMTVEKRKFYDRFEVDGQLLCTMGKQKSKIWLHYSRCTDSPAPDQPEFVEFVEMTGWGTGHWRSAIRNQADFDKALSILERLYGHK